MQILDVDGQCGYLTTDVSFGFELALSADARHVAVWCWLEHSTFIIVLFDPIVILLCFLAVYIHHCSWKLAKRHVQRSRDVAIDPVAELLRELGKGSNNLDSHVSLELRQLPLT